jgi:hypothetical protein
MGKMLVSEEKSFKQFSHKSYVKTMSADGGHFGPRSGSLNTFLANLKQTWHGWSLSGQFSKLCPVTLTSIQDGHLQQT